MAELQLTSIWRFCIYTSAACILSTNVALSLPISSTVVASVTDSFSEESGLSDISLRGFGEAEDFERFIGVDAAGNIIVHGEGTVADTFQGFQGIFSIAQGTTGLTPLVTTGQSDGNGRTFRSISDGFRINDAGTIAFGADLVGGEQSALYKIDNGGTLSTVHDDFVPSEGLFGVTADGGVLFNAFIDGKEGLREAPADGGAFRDIAVFGQGVPDDPDAFLRFVDTRTKVNAAGDAAIITDVIFENGSRLHQDGIYLAPDGGPLEFVAARDEPPPNVPGNVTVDRINGVILGENGELGFYAQLFDLDTGDSTQGVFYGTSAGNMELVTQADRELNFVGHIDDNGRFFYSLEDAGDDVLFVFDPDNVEFEPLLDSDTETEFGRLFGYQPVGTLKDGTLIFYAGTSENRDGYFALEADGTLTPVLREGDIIDGKEISFIVEPESGQFALNGNTLATIVTSDGDPIVIRTQLVEPQSTDFTWTGSCGSSNWHDTSCSDTNWSAGSDPAQAPPGDSAAGDENATIVDATVRIADRAVTLNSLNATGELQLENTLTLGGEAPVVALGPVLQDEIPGEPSTIENLQLSGAGKLISNTETSLTGEGNVSGGAKEIIAVGDGVVVNKGTLNIAAVETLIGGTFRNESIINQTAPVFINGRVENERLWNLRNSTISEKEPLQGKFVNFDDLAATGASKVDTAYLGENNSEIKVRDNGSVLQMSGGAEFKGETFIEFERGTTVQFDGIEFDYRVSGSFNETTQIFTPGVLTLKGIDGAAAFRSGTLEVGFASSLTADPGSRIAVEEQTLKISGGDLIGRIELLDGEMEFSAGRLGLAGDPAKRADIQVSGGDGLLRINGESGDTRSLSGSITVNPFARVGQSADLDISGSTISIGNDARWDINGAQLLSNADSRINTAAGGLIPVEGGTRFALGGQLSIALPDEENASMTFGGTVDNKGGIIVTRGAVILNGDVLQREGSTLKEGVWIARGDNTSLQIGDGVIDTIGAEAAVTLSNNGKIANLDLLLNNGNLQILDTSLTTSGSIVNAGSIGVSGTFPTDGSVNRDELIVSGRFGNSGDLRVGSSARVVTTEYTTVDTSKTHIDGRLEITEVDAVFRGKISGDGVISALGIETRAAEINTGNSPGKLTFDTRLFIADENTVFNIEVGGTEAGVSYDLILFTGDVVLGGTIIFNFIDGFVPEGDDLFTFFQFAGAIAGQFDQIIVEGLGVGAGFSLVSDLQAGTLVLADVEPGTIGVPEPETFVLLAVGLFGIAAVRRRRDQYAMSLAAR